MSNPNTPNHAKQSAFDHLKAELERAFAAPESSYRALTAAEVLARNNPAPAETV